ncbi:helix-turn-helix domain-containing protein [Stutzerimonas nitrititolerans]|uniref:helix-turn-helix domain-containing protein n=1 Tax=Stutzerimonas nitrititolerans TaxID=2482751 RepID=UPI0014822F08|nr:helix-turn-helix transcriptional regulator [Stutzerimonas nitrititolerans]MBA1184515.1 helix-turn-helix transcriptional regulator [Stutzerimonas stutzeri]NNT92964.1 helix-turn-helix transcriptional regulator [Stutzerimonas nitrititolerans]
MSVTAIDLEDRPRDFGERLLEERKRLNLEVHELAHLAGMTDYMQKRFENGTSTIPIDYLQALAARSDADVLYIITGTRSR